MIRKPKLIQSVSMTLVENEDAAYFVCGKCGERGGLLRRRDRTDYGRGALMMAYHMEDEHP